MILSFFEERKVHSLSYSSFLSLTLLWRLPLTDAMVCCYDGVHSGSLEKRVKFITRAQTFCLFFFSRRTKCRVVCVCVSVCVWVVYLCIGIITIHSNEMLSFSNALSRIHRELTRSRSLSLSFAHAHIHARRYSVGIMFILFLVLKISRSFLEKAFFPSSFGRCNL